MSGVSLDVLAAGEGWEACVPVRALLDHPTVESAAAVAGYPGLGSQPSVRARIRPRAVVRSVGEDA
ncbi:hypothetical protein CU254_16115 [Amycolatopsis sp. AA4]|uniref:hypothetical protein n=1 Tax=Actinomycetes TaxID=1760 RepID=UPI0001B5751C|nr:MULTISPECIES: hypothetical protein [Actinomycetes]ATY11819.1 hypothetical protein CU254_16115 [Amycolatopsis sp. AA4]EFL07498.1 predicted protein [Streptomyces sp. AA4]